VKILTAQQMREIDRLTVECCGVPYPTLMEMAGARVVEAIIGEPSVSRLGASNRVSNKRVPSEAELDFSE